VKPLPGDLLVFECDVAPHGIIEEFKIAYAMVDERQQAAQALVWSLADRELQVEAKLALARLGVDRGAIGNLQDVIPNLSSTSPTFRVAALKMLPSIGCVARLVALDVARLLLDDDEEVRDNALLALMALNFTDAVALFPADVARWEPNSQADLLGLQLGNGKQAVGGKVYPDTVWVLGDDNDDKHFSRLSESETRELHGAARRLPIAQRRAGGKSGSTDEEASAALLETEQRIEEGDGDQPKLSSRPLAARPAMAQSAARDARGGSGTVSVAESFQDVDSLRAKLHDDSDWHERAWAAGRLGALGYPTAARAEVELRQAAAEDASWEVRTAAKGALKKVQAAKGKVQGDKGIE